MASFLSLSEPRKKSRLHKSSMVDIAPIVVFGLTLSAVYALVGVGFTLILSLRGVVNLAFGGYLLLGAYIYYGLTQNGFGGIVALLLAVFATSVASLVLYLSVVQFIEHNEEQTFVVTFLVALGLEELVTWYYSPQSVLLSAPIQGQTNISGIVIPNTEIGAIISALLVLVLFILFINYTITGQAIIAMSLDEVGANLVGIDTERVNYVTWLISGGMAGLAGVFLGSQFGASPTMWLTPLVIAFGIIVVGGIGSIKGAIIVSILIGFVETITISVFSPSWEGVTTFILLIFVLMIRPTGLFGREVIENG
jgi:branched-chain amino acid transport system permease protein